MSTAIDIIAEMTALADDAEARHLMRFFKTGKGEYGEGDRFLGIRVPVTREIVKKYKRQVGRDDVAVLVDSEFHEIRLAGFLLLLELYQRAKKAGDESAQRELKDYYLTVIDRGNNWDLVDLICYKLLGDWLVTHPGERGVLDRLAAMEGRLWHQRVAMVSTLAMIKAGECDDALRIARCYLNHPHDLIHKATGWMLREIGKHGARRRLIDFLENHSPMMPRTMLRYAIEHFTPAERRRYLDIKSPFHNLC